MNTNYLKKSWSLYLLATLLLINLVACKKIDPELLNGNKSPVIKLIYPNNDAAFPLDTILFAASAHDPDGHIVSVWMFCNGDLVKIDTVAPWQIELIFPETGDLSVVMFAVDDKGQQSNSEVKNIKRSDYFYCYLQTDVTPVMSGDSATFTATAYPANQIKNIICYFDDQVIAQSSGNTVSFTVKSLESGLHRFYAIAENLRGSKVRSKDRFIDLRENQPPQVSLFAYAPNGLAVGSYMQFNYRTNDPEHRIDSVKVFCNDSIIHISTEVYSEGDFIFIPQNSNQNIFYAVIIDKGGLTGTSDIIQIDIPTGRTLPYALIQVMAGENAEVIYGLSSGTVKKLLRFNPFSGEVFEYNLPFSHPARMIYSENDKKLYIAYQNTNKVSVLNTENQMFGEFEYAASLTVSDIKVDPIRRRIYLACENKIAILNQDDFSVLTIANVSNTEAHDLAIIPAEGLMIAKRNNHSAVHCFKVDNDEVLLQNSFISQTNLHGQFQINETDGWITSPGLSQDGQILALSFDLTNVVGHFDSNYGGINNILSHSDDLYFSFDFSSYEGKADIFNAHNFLFKYRIIIPKTSTALFCTNSNQERLVVFNSDLSNALYAINIAEFLP